MKRVFFTGPVIKVLAAFASIAGLALVIYLLSGMPRPREEDRVTTGNGEFSIIKPRGWNGTSAYSPAGERYVVAITCEPTKAIGVGPRLVIARVREAPNVQELKALGWKPFQFQTTEALFSTETSKRNFYWRAVFEQGGHWYEMLLRLDLPEDIPNSGWWPFVNSFKAEKMK